jgi:ABC-type protease/lipase transport system fused ATPase/permease subunit
MTELVWFWLIYNMHGLLYDSLKIGNLKLMAFSSNFFFGNAAVIDELFSSEEYPTLGVFLYLKIFMIYQFFCVFQWLYMLVLNRTYQEANHSERYVRLYRIGKTHDGSYKSQEIRLM